MQTQPKKYPDSGDEDLNRNTANQNDSDNPNDAVEDDGTPVLDEEDLWKKIILMTTMQKTSNGIIRDQKNNSRRRRSAEMQCRRSVSVT